MITYDDKVSTVSNPLPDINKVTDADMNEIKSVVNTNETALGTKVPTSRILTIDGTPFDLSADRSWTTSGGTDKFTNTYNVAQNGLVGDDATDNSAALTALVAAAVEGSWLYFPVGIYRFLTSVVITKKLHIVGDGIASYIKTTVNNITVLDYDYTGDAQVADLNVRDIRIGCEPSVTPVSPSCGLRIQNSSERLRLERVYVRGFYNNIFMTNPTEYVFDKLYCLGFVESGLDMRSSGPVFTDAGDGVITNSYFIPATYNSQYCIYQENGGGLKISNCKFNYQPSPVFKANYSYYYEGTGATVDLMICNNSFENFALAAIRVGVSGSGSFTEVCITSNDIGGTSNSGADGIILSGIDQVAITGNAIVSPGAGAGGTRNGITLTNCDNVTLHNTYFGWTNDVVQSGSTLVTTPVLIDPAVSPSNDDVLQRKSGVWTNRTIAQLITDLEAGGMTGTGDVVGPGSSTANYPVVFDGTTGKLIKQGNAIVNWAASLAEDGWSGTPGTLTSYYYDDGVRIHIFVNISGTSDSAIATFQLPVAPNAVYGAAGIMAACHVQNNGTGAVGRAYASGGGTTVTVDRDQTGTAWMASGTKTVRVTLLYFK